MIVGRSSKAPGSSKYFSSPTCWYDGGAYAGWQFQPDRPTVQGAFEAAWRQITQETLRVTARTGSLVMAVEHVRLPRWGVQFHPESILSDRGHDLLKNFLKRVH